MDAHMLVETTAPSGLPAPLWFVEFFKVLGFALHAVPMGLWYAGLLLAMLLHWRGSEYGRRFGSRLMAQMPVIVAFGVNLGVVPLLFVQVAYPRLFYPATILMAWFWMAIIALLIPAYYGVYLYSFGLRDGGVMAPLRRAAGWCAAVMFIVIGFLFANGFSLMVNVADWKAIWNQTSVAGAALGTGLNTADPTLWPRWLLMFGLALTTTAAWVVVDAAWFGRRESDPYQRWAPGFAWKLYTVGLAWFAVAGSWYAFGTWSEGVSDAMFRGPLIVLTAATALAPGLPWLLMFFAWRRDSPISRPAAALVGAAQFAVLGINAVSRQIVQDVEIAGYFPDYFRLADKLKAVQWSPLVAFLLVFVGGIAVIVWMVAQAMKASPEPSE